MGAVLSDDVHVSYIYTYKLTIIVKLYLHVSQNMTMYIYITSSETLLTDKTLCTSLGSFLTVTAS